MHVSVIVPCHNVEAFVARAVESAIAQTHPDLKVIAVDDGSTDGTLQVLRGLQARHPDRLTVVAQANAGACAARNAGLRQSTGTYVQFLDADDLIRPDKVAHQAKLAEERGADVVVGSAEVYPSDGGPPHTEVQTNKDPDPWFELMRHGLGRTSQHLWRRAAVEAVGGWNEEQRSSQEYELLFRLLRNGARITYDEVVLTEIHQRPGSITHTGLAANWVRNTRLRARIMEHLRTHRDGCDLRRYQQVVFDCIRVLHVYSPQEAGRLHAELIPSGFRPIPSPTSSRAYVAAYRLFGFHGAERIRKLLRGR